MEIKKTKPRGSLQKTNLIREKNLKKNIYIYTHRHTYIHRKYV